MSQPPVSSGQPPYGNQPPAPYSPSPYPDAPYQGGPYQGGPYPGGPEPSPAPASNRKLIIGLVAVGVVLLLCCAGGLVVLALRPASDTTSRVEPERPAVDPVAPAGSTGSTGSTGSANPAVGANLDLAVGAPARFTDEDGGWTITLVGLAWRTENCGDHTFFPGPDGKLLIVAIAFEVTSGTASINSLFFDFIGSDHERAGYGLLSGCDEPSLESDSDLPAGSKRTGKVVFDVTGAPTGSLQYDNLFGDNQGSWKITA